MTDDLQVRINCKGSSTLPLGELRPFQGNLKTLTEASYVKLRGLITSMGFSFPVFVWHDADNKQNYILDGHQRVRVLQKMVEEGYKVPNIPVADVKADSFKDAKKKLMAAASQFGDVDKQGLYEFLADNEWEMDFLDENFKLPEVDLDDFRAEFFDDPSDGDGGDGGLDDDKQVGSLQEKFIVPPFSVLDTRQGYWQEARSRWIDLGIRSEIGRSENLLSFAAASQAQAHGRSTEAYKNSTSIFDPLLAEICYRWFCPVGGRILDPFAGGSVRGIVASKLGFEYVGVELREEQVESNREQAERICTDGPKPVWICGDSLAEIPKLEDNSFDFLYSCPPYLDLEVYSDDKRDLSQMSGAAFYKNYFEIIAACATKLKDDAFAGWVISEVRAKDGYYRQFVPSTVHAFADAGMRYYNEAILVNSLGSLPIRAGRIFTASRKLGRTHQNVLVFCKGDWKKIIPRLETMEANEADLMDAVDYEQVNFIDQIGDTPVQKINHKNKIICVKRDDLFAVGGVRGGKVRTCWGLAQGAKGLVTAGSRSSPQVNIVAHVARKLGIPCQVHTPEGELSPEVVAAQRAGAEVIQHKAGYNNVIIKRAHDAAKEKGWTEIPFGMECQAAVDQTRKSVQGIGDCTDWERLVIPVGSGMSLAGVLWGLQDLGIDKPVLGVQVGADPKKRLDKYAPKGWGSRVELVKSKLKYDQSPKHCKLGDIHLDPIYEAKCLPYLQHGDLLWIVGIRQTAPGGLPELLD